MPTTSFPIEDRYTIIQQRIDEAAKEAGRPSSDVTLLAVSKRQTEASIKTLMELGHRNFGENQVQEWQRKALAFEGTSDVQWHLIGPVQTNKAKFIARNPPTLLHTIDRPALVEALEKRLNGSQQLKVLVQVTIDGEMQKAGVSPENLRPLAEMVSMSAHLTLGGLMCIPAVGPDPRHAFSRLRTLGETIQDLSTPRLELSMGMSQDFESAIREGSTIVRVGSALFGPRA